MAKPGRKRSPYRGRVEELAKQRFSPREIFLALDGKVKASSIVTMISEARKRGADIPLFPRNAGRIQMTNGHVRAFMGPARLRGVTPFELTRQLLDVMAEEPSLIAAILDDGVSS